ncbi:MAG: hypothetical protein GC164_14585 [Phycisphaera sp.]|nr:hypothetical protein [Phycisphaera sp.]
MANLRLALRAGPVSDHPYPEAFSSMKAHKVDNSQVTALTTLPLAVDGFEPPLRRGGRSLDTRPAGVREKKMFGRMLAMWAQGTLAGPVKLEWDAEQDATTPVNKPGKRKSGIEALLKNDWKSMYRGSVLDD